MTKEGFFAMSRDEMRSWAKKYHITIGGTRKEQMALEILAKIGPTWEFDSESDEYRARGRLLRPQAKYSGHTLSAAGHFRAE